MVAEVVQVAEFFNEAFRKNSSRRCAFVLGDTFQTDEKIETKGTMSVEWKVQGIEKVGERNNFKYEGG